MRGGEIREEANAKRVRKLREVNKRGVNRGIEGVNDRS